MHSRAPVMTERPGGIEKFPQDSLPLRHSLVTLKFRSVELNTTHFERSSSTQQPSARPASDTRFKTPPTRTCFA